MRVIAFVVLACTAAVCLADSNAPAVSEELLTALKTKGATWEFGPNKFSNYTRADVRMLLGAKMHGFEDPDLPVVDNEVSLPVSFDSRTEWPQSIHAIRNQEQCGSCWAFAATEALSDRFAIQSNNSINVVLSPQELVSCDNQDGNQGCNGGYPIRAWKYMSDKGVVNDTCYPYTSGQGVTGTCKIGHGTTQCPSGSGTIKYFKAKSYYSIKATPAAIATEIMTHGPIEVAFSVYQDFFSYKSGVYKHTSGSLDGGHAVKMIGWGVEDGEDYWLVANSWGADWGINGFFKILKGVDECGIESAAVAGLADV